MFCSRRHLLAAGAALPALSPREAGALTADDDPASELLALSQASNAALMRGDIEAYQALIALAPDFALMSPFGGKPTHAAQVDAEAMRRMGRFFRNGDLRIEVVQTWAAADMVVLAYIERSRAEVGGLPSQEWALRVTLVYRRDKNRWLLAHRHADPLVGGIGLREAAALAARPAPAS